MNDENNKKGQAKRRFAGNTASRSPPAGASLALVYEKRARTALACRPEALSCLDFGDHAPANTRRNGCRVLYALSFSPARHRCACPSRRGRTAQTLGRARLLQPRTELAKSGSPDYGKIRRRFPLQIRRYPRAARHWRLHGRRHFVHLF